MTKQTKLSIIVARGSNGVIGVDGQLPWNLKDDLLHFKETTLNSTVIMGRKTWESLARRPLTQRENIVVSRDWNYNAGTRVYSNFNTAVGDAEVEAMRSGKSQVFVAGGAEIYQQAMPKADRMYITEVDVAPPGDAFFPDFDESEWREIDRKEFAASEFNEHAFVIRVLDRIED